MLGYWTTSTHTTYADVAKLHVDSLRDVKLRRHCRRMVVLEPNELKGDIPLKHFMCVRMPAQANQFLRFFQEDLCLVNVPNVLVGCETKDIG